MLRRLINKPEKAAANERSAKMTTIIMISQDSSVIIGPEDDSASRSPEGKRPESGEESVEPKTPLLGAQGEHQPKKRERRYNNSLSTVESDESEELNTNSNSSSAASTLSSGNSLGLELPTQRSSASGTEGSSGSRGTTAGDSAFLSSPESCEDIGKHKSKVRVAKPQRRSLPRTLSFSSGSSSSIFITSTPSTSKDDSALSLGCPREMTESHGRWGSPGGHIVTPGGHLVTPGGHRGTPVGPPPAVPGRTYSSPANGPHGIKFYINSATGKADLKTTNGGEGLLTRSLGRIVEAPTLSVAMPSVEILAANSNVDSYCTANRKNGHPPSRKKLPSTFSIYSDIHDLQSLLRRQQNITEAGEGHWGSPGGDLGTPGGQHGAPGGHRKILPLTEEDSEEDGWNANDVCADIIGSTESESDEESSSNLTSSPLAAELASCCSSSSKNSSAPSGKVAEIPSDD